MLTLDIFWNGGKAEDSKGLLAWWCGPVWSVLRRLGHRVNGSGLFYPSLVTDPSFYPTELFNTVSAICWLFTGNLRLRYHSNFYIPRRDFGHLNWWELLFLRTMTLTLMVTVPFLWLYYVLLGSAAAVCQWIGKYFIPSLLFSISLSQISFLEFISFLANFLSCDDMWDEMIFSPSNENVNQIEWARCTIN